MFSTKTCKLLHHSKEVVCTKFHRDISYNLEYYADISYKMKESCNRNNCSTGKHSVENSSFQINHINKTFKNMGTLLATLQTWFAELPA